MKKLFKYILPAIVGVCSFSCEESLTEINQDPNGSTTANPAATFVSGASYYGLMLEGYVNELDALFAQYVAGGPGVALIDDERYFFQNTDYNTEWSLAYNQALSDLSFTIQNGNEAQAAVADILSVHIWQVLVDHYGSIPYSEALKGTEGILAPKYDEPKAIYDDLVARLTASIELLGETPDELGQEDIFYYNPANAEETEEEYAIRIESWIRFANSLKLKLLMRQSITNGAEVGPKVVELIQNGIFIETEEQIARIPYAGASGLNYNPMFARREAGVGQFYVASQTTVDAMSQLDDPRLAIIYDAAENFPGQIRGMVQGNVEDVVAPSRDDYSFPSSVAYAADNDVILISHWEVYFLRAEAAMRFATGEDEEAMFNTAVTAHFDYVGAAGAATYLNESANYDAAASAQVKSDMIGVQKWISFNGLQEFEGWTEARRFDTPESKVFTSTTTGIFDTPTRSTLGTGVFPTLRLYPQTETSYNQANAPSNRATTDKVFWDN